MLFFRFIQEFLIFHHFPVAISNKLKKKIENYQEVFFSILYFLETSTVIIFVWKVFCMLVFSLKGLLCFFCIAARARNYIKCFE